jgi:hypothetical protein
VKIPVATPTSRELTSEAPARRINRDEMGNSGQIMQEAGKTVVNIGEQIEKVVNIRQKTQAENTLNQRLLDIEQRASVDPDISSQRQLEYQSEINRSHKDAANMISMPLERNLFSEDAKTKGMIYGLKVRNIYAQKNIETSIAALTPYIQTEGTLR